MKRCVRLQQYGTRYSDWKNVRCGSLAAPIHSSLGRQYRLRLWTMEEGGGLGQRFRDADGGLRPPVQNQSRNRWGREGLSSGFSDGHCAAREINRLVTTSKVAVHH